MRGELYFSSSSMSANSGRNQNLIRGELYVSSSWIDSSSLMSRRGLTGYGVALLLIGRRGSRFSYIPKSLGVEAAAGGFIFRSQGHFPWRKSSMSAGDGDGGGGGGDEGLALL